RCVQRVDPAEEIRDLQADEEQEKRVDRDKGRCAGGGAQEVTKTRQDGGRRCVRAPSRDDEEAARDPGEGGGNEDPADELAYRPVAEIEHVGHRAREDGIRAREEEREDDEEREGECDADTNGRDPSAAPPCERTT